MLHHGALGVGLNLRCKLNFLERSAHTLLSSGLRVYSVSPRMSMKGRHGRARYVESRHSAWRTNSSPLQFLRGIAGCSAISCTHHTYMVGLPSPQRTLSCVLLVAGVPPRRSSLMSSICGSDRNGTRSCKLRRHVCKPAQDAMLASRCCIQRVHSVSSNTGSQHQLLAHATHLQS